MRQFGGPEVLRLENVPDPSLAPYDVMVKVHAVSINRTLDCRVRAGLYITKPELPHVLGCDPTGIVEATGRAVRDVKVGDRVAIPGRLSCGQCPVCRHGQASECKFTKQLGLNCWGGYAEYVSVPAINVRLLPDNVPLVDACFINRHFPQAFHLLEGAANLQAGEWLLVMGAAGALGSCLVQVGRLLDARVIAGAGSAERAASCLANGADFAVNYRAEDLIAEVLRITAGHGVDVVAENIGDPTLWSGSFGSLARNGRLVTVGSHGGGLVELDITRLYVNRLKIIGASGSRHEDVRRTLEAMAAGQLRASIGKILPLREAAKGHIITEAQAVIGKVVLTP